MTFDTGDSVLFGERVFFLAGVNGRGLFQPKEHGLNPETGSTPDRRGFRCVYRLDERILLLERVRLGLSFREQLMIKAGKGPSIRGLSPHVEAEGKLRVVYSGRHGPMPFSGGLLLGDDFIHVTALPERESRLRQFAMHPAFEWYEVLELVFEAGNLVQERNCSVEMRQVRSRLVSSQDGSNGDSWRKAIAGLVESVFFFDYGGSVR